MNRRHSQLMRLSALVLAALVLFETTSPAVIAAEQAQRKKWFTVALLIRETPDSVKAFIDSIRENMQYQNPSEYERRIKEIAQIYYQYELDNESVPKPALLNLDQILSALEEDYITDRQMVEVDRFASGILELALAFVFTGLTNRFEKVHPKINARFEEMKPQALTVIQQTLSRLDDQIASLEATISTPISAKATAVEARAALYRKLKNHPIASRRKGAGKVLARMEKEIRNRRLSVYGREQAQVKKQQEKTLDQLKAEHENTENCIKDLEEGRATHPPRWTFTSWSEYLKAWGVGPRRVPSVEARKFATNDILLLFQEMQRVGKARVDSKKISPQLVKEFRQLFGKDWNKDPQATLNRAYDELRENRFNRLFMRENLEGLHLQDLRPRELMAVAGWFKKRARDLGIRLKDVRENPHWLQFYTMYLYERLVFTGDIHFINLGVLPILGGYSIFTHKNPENWWFPTSTPALSTYFGNLRREPLAIVEEVVKDFRRKYEARWEAINPGFSNAEDSKRDNPAALSRAYRAQLEVEKKEKQLTFAALREIKTKVPPSDHSLLPQPSRPEAWEDQLSSLVPEELDAE